MARPGLLKRKFYIKKQFQGRFILLYTLAISTIVGLGVGLLYLQIDKAVERHLYTTHIKIEQVGDFLADLLFNINFMIILAIVIAVLGLSLLIFRRINNNFSRMDETIQAMSRGDFTRPFTCDGCFMQAGDLTDILEQTRMNELQRFEQLSEALNDLEQGVLQSSDQKLVQRGKDKLNQLLEKITLS